MRETPSWSSSTGPRILFLTPRYPYPPWRGDQVRVFNLVKALAGRASVRVVAIGDGEPFPLTGVEVRSVTPRISGRVLANLLTRPTIPTQVRLFLDQELRRAMAEEISSWRPDVIHVTLARMGPYLPDAGPFHRHLDLVDSLGRNMKTRAQLHRGLGRAAFSLEARMMTAYEARLAALADSCSVVSDADRRMRGLERAAVIPNGVDIDSFPFAVPGEAPPRLIFFGNLGYFHNVEPARFLAERVLPLVRERVPGAVLRLVGARPTAAVRDLAAGDGVELAADVPDLAAELSAAAVALLPSFSGSGIKNKVLEAFCAGVPVVANELGVEGVEGAIAGEHYVAAETPAQIADAAVALLAELERRRRLALAANRLVVARYSWERQAERLLDLYRA